MISDLRLALRHLWRNPGFAITATVTLGLGIGLVSTQFTLIDGLLLRDLPFPDPDRLVHIGRLTQSGFERSWQPLTAEEYRAIESQQKVFEGIAAFRGENINMSRHGGPPRRLQGTAVSATFFELLRTEAAVGRVFRPGDDRIDQPALAVISHQLWQSEFQGDPDIAGRMVRLNGETATIVGVMPGDFQFPGKEDCWINLRLNPNASVSDQPQFVELMGRLSRQATAREAEASLAVILGRTQELSPQSQRRPPFADVRPFQFAYVGSGSLTLLGTMWAMTFLVLLLACGNVALLLMARTASQARHLAIRAALGAHPRRIIRQILIESVTLAAFGSILGILLAWAGAQLLRFQVRNGVEVSTWVDFEINVRLLVFVIVMAAISGLLAGLLPALRAAWIPAGETLKDESRGATRISLGRWSRWLVAGQVAFACSLGILASLLATSAFRSSRANLAFDPNRLLIGRIELQGQTYENAARRTRFYAELLDRVRATPGVLAAAVSSRDLVNPGVFSGFEIEGLPPTDPPNRPGGWLEVVSRDYFGVVARGALSGRVFTAEDHAASTPVAIVNRSLAARYWPDSNAIGHRIRRDEPNATWATIVGVVPDLGMEGIGNQDPAAGWYLLQDQQSWGWLDLLVRTQGEPASLIPALRRSVADVDSAQPIHTLSTLRERTDRRLAGLRVVGGMSVVFAAVALALSGVGVYGVVSFMIGRRTREFGVRIALGASRWRILTLISRQYLPRSLSGMVLGLGLGYALAIPLANFLPKISITDPSVYGGVSLLLLVIVAIAYGLPSARAAGIDPATTLRSD